jgi:hypothetical protein
MAAAVTLDVGAVIDRSRAFLLGGISMMFPEGISRSAVATPT